MYVPIQRLVFMALLALLAAGCFEPSAVEDTGPQDSGKDQAVADLLIQDGPRKEGLKTDGPLADLLLKDSGPDAVACPPSKAVWGTMVWGGGCLWQ